MIDSRGFRANVGIILVNDQGKVFFARRVGMADAWQFPQGGMQEGETHEESMYRELHEELGLYPEDVEILGKTKGWLKYYLPKHLRRYYSKPLCIGQKQKWFLLKLVSDENKIRLDSAETPEFEEWRWVDYWHPKDAVISFKQRVYELALKEFESLVK